MTGSGSAAGGGGIGSSIAILFGREGAQVYVVDRDPQRAAATVATIVAEDGLAFAIPGDVTNGKDCEAVVAAATERHGRIDILVNNVGIAGGPKDVQMDDAVWDRVMATNLKSAMLMSREAVPRMPRGGAIVNITSIAGLRANGLPAYGASKAGLIMLTRDLAVLHGRQGVRANVIAPGHLYTPMVEGLFSEVDRERRRRIAPIGLEGNAWDIAWAAVFLASDEARFITGACLPVDGGVTEIGALAAYRLLNQDADGHPDE